MPETAFDLIVIGSGPAGYVGAIRAAQLGMRVACVEKEKVLGGTCLNIGCIPSKALLDSSEYFHLAAHSFATHGIHLENLAIDLPQMLRRKDQVVGANNKGIAALFRKHKVETIPGIARILGPGKVGVGERVVEGKNILLCSGSEPIPLPSVPFDGKRIVSSTEALSFSEVPERFCVIGAGAIGLELGSVWRRLGSEVVIVDVADRCVPGMDSEMSRLLQRSLERQGMKFRFKSRVDSARVDAGGVTVKIVTEGAAVAVEEKADRCLVAVGRRPYVKDLKLEEAGIRLDSRQRIEVDGNYQTSVPGIFAVGDVIAGPMLAHKASEEAVAAVEKMVGRAGHVNYATVPSVVYTSPEYASVGVTEDEAREKGHAVRIGKFPFTASGRARALGETEGQVKVIADAETDRVVGVHIVGPRASDLIAEAVVAMEFAGSAEDLARTIHAHPSLSEAIKEAALAVDGRAIHF